MSIPTVTAEAVRQAVLRVAREGPWKMLARVEHTEPELAAYLLEELTDLHHALRRAGGRVKRVRSLDQRIQSLMAVTAMCLINASGATRPPHSTASTANPSIN